MPFDPDKFLAETKPAQRPFDPDKFLAETGGIPEQKEAELGIGLRAQYALEPIQSNREALLVQELGPENVQKDEHGQLYVKQFGEFRPVNVEGLSMADFANFLGALPEAVGGVVGTVAGALGGGGVASVPAAIGLGAAGGAVGSAARQALSAAIGTPQVADITERAVETGISAAMGGAGSVAGAGIKAAGKTFGAGLKKIFPSFGVTKEGKELIETAAKEGIPAPTPGQLAGGRDLDLEKVLLQRPIVGRKLRKQVDAQIEAIKENIKGTVGDFMNVDSTADVIGADIKALVNSNIKATKAAASQAFDEVASQGADIFVPSAQVKKEVVGNLAELGIFDKAGKPLKHTSKTGLTVDQFGRLQGIFKSVLDDIDNSVDGIVDANSLNTMRKFLDANIKEGGKQGFDDVALIKAREAFMDATESMLNAKDPGLKDQFKTARRLWAEHLDMKDSAKKLRLLDGMKGAQIDDPKVARSIFTSTERLKAFKKVADQDTIEKGAINFLNDIMSERLGKEAQISAAGALKAVKQNRATLVDAIGLEKYNSLKDNLQFLDKIGAPVNPSKTFISEIISDVSLRGIFGGISQLGAYKSRRAASGLAANIAKLVEKAPETGAVVGNLLTDKMQREYSTESRGKRR